MVGVEALEGVDRVQQCRCAGLALGIVAGEAGVEIVDGDNGYLYLLSAERLADQEQ